jgi:hypothetical protein
MTRKDFNLIASVIKKLATQKAHCFDNTVDVYRVAETFAEALQFTNSNFDKQRFIEASVIEMPTEDDLKS